MSIPNVQQVGDAEWSSRDDVKLIAFCANGISFENISRQLPHHCPRSCFEHATHFQQLISEIQLALPGRTITQGVSAEDEVKAAQYSASEDNMITSLHNDGHPWEEIGRRLNRSSNGCRQRYSSHLTKEMDT